ncbi:MAG: branched-chain amino acid aminotransferase [Rickettsiales bacterium]|jgi:branched-chain amino acid aminotransferase|nr:branched-chain amino acid aminotransferase [Rickettsiales bacterium]
MALIPFDDRDGWIWFNGQMVPWREAKVHVLTHGLHYGSCVFEGERAYGGKIFKSREHAERLHKSGELLGFKIPFSVDVLIKAKEDVIAKNNLVDAYLRPVAWRGSEMMAVSAQQTKIHVAIAAWQWPSYFGSEAKEKGLRLQVARWARPAPNTAPTASKAAGLYMICTVSKHEAEAAGYNDALMHDYRGFIAEATGANVFFMMDGKLHTPKPDCFLDGITRRTVIELARQHKIELVERHIKPEELAQVSEAFLTGSAAEVMPIGSIGEHQFKVGEATKTLMNAYQRLVQE